jgi:hypothetical protein
MARSLREPLRPPLRAAWRATETETETTVSEQASMQDFAESRGGACETVSLAAAHLSGEAGRTRRQRNRRHCRIFLKRGGKHEATNLEGTGASGTSCHSSLRSEPGTITTN